MSELSITKEGRIFLRLPGKSYKAERCIGRMEGDTLVVERDPERHLFRSSNSYGFNFELIRRGKFKILCVLLPFGERMYTTKDFLLAHGKFLNFQRNQLEKQIFLRLEDFGLEKALAWEREQDTTSQGKMKQEKAAQLGLFGGAR